MNTDAPYPTPSPSFASSLSSSAASVNLLPPGTSHPFYGMPNSYISNDMGEIEVIETADADSVISSLFLDIPDSASFIDNLGRANNYQSIGRNIFLIALLMAGSTYLITCLKKESTLPLFA